VKTVPGGLQGALELTQSGRRLRSFQCRLGKSVDMFFAGLGSNLSVAEIDALFSAKVYLLDDVILPLMRLFPLPERAQIRELLA